MCNNENMQRNYEQIKFSDNTNNMNNKKSSLKRTESKMDESPQGEGEGVRAACVHRTHSPHTPNISYICCANMSWFNRFSGKTKENI
jgi:hypothetical protein